jgi:hypothetical protein
MQTARTLIATNDPQVIPLNMHLVPDEARAIGWRVTAIANVYFFIRCLRQFGLLHRQATIWSP